MEVAKVGTGVVGAGVCGPRVPVCTLLREGLAGFPIRDMIWDLQ